MGMQREPGHRVHEDGLPAGGTASRAPPQVHRCFHVHERQRHEFGEPACFHLQVAQPHQVSRPVHRAFHMSEHDGGGGAQARRVGIAHHIEPLAGFQFIHADHSPYVVIKDLRGRSRQRAQARGFQLKQEFTNRQAQRMCTVRDFQRRKRVHMHGGLGALHGAADLQIGFTGVIRVDAALHADFGCATAPRFADAARNLIHRQVVGRAAQGLVCLAF